MQPRKNPKYDLESRKTFHFLIGLSLALLFVIVVFEIKTPTKSIVPPEPKEPEEIVDLNIPITTREELKKPEPEVLKKDIDDNLPPEVKPDDEVEKLLLDNLLPPDDNKLEDIEDGGMEDLDKIETLPPAVIQHVARPSECKDVYGGDAQRQCLNEFMQAYVKRNAKVPELAKQMGVQGAVVVNFVVDEFGKITDVRVIRGEHEVLNEEAEKLVNTLPDFIPASQFGKKVRMRMNLRVNFKY